MAMKIIRKPKIRIIRKSRITIIPKHRITIVKLPKRCYACGGMLD